MASKPAERVVVEPQLPRPIHRALAGRASDEVAQRRHRRPGRAILLQWR
jgi:hypothetical protein